MTSSPFASSRFRLVGVGVLGTMSSFFSLFFHLSPIKCSPSGCFYNTTSPLPQNHETVAVTALPSFGPCIRLAGKGSCRLLRHPAKLHWVILTMLTIFLCVLL
ncbi:hypothetical protein QBC35DRAFT_272536 [Podospora australis]|uniref:Uncharacterized protein n=1 Tax=Podospora australis TaxID=1536484 RepID=A0AAN6WRY6_9PEZI|nr:hypothetical protein QBC35DRAFT_272536 [Podospora australis]